MERWRELYRQRLRWKRDALENISEYDLRRVTTRHWRRQRFTLAATLIVEMPFQSTTR
jgi:hypothetical protein